MQRLEKTLKSALASKAAILAAGNDFRRDDGAGPALVKFLKGKTAAALIDGGQTPENRVFEIIKLAPKTLIIVDAADMDRKPGEIAVIAESDVSNASFSSHMLPLTVLTDFLKRELKDLRVIFIGIQPADTGFGEGLTPAVSEAVKRLADIIGNK
ncbi:MAG: hydrogenase 3 maturation endopeptidase HyCI [Elusimicrobiales bacterium]|nr:hydrogenase 3 maturation endopeptidase HyCI [Elusimicrobiales bacterium]